MFEVQLWAPHDVVASGYVHATALLPSHFPAQSEPSVPHAGRVPCGAPVVSVVHVPFDAARSHAWHWPPHA